MNRKIFKMKIVSLILLASMSFNSFDIKAFELLGKYPSNQVSTFYVASNCPSAAVTPISSAVSTWNSASPSSFRFSLANSGNKSTHKAVYNSSKKDLNSDGYNSIGTLMNATTVSALAGPMVVAFCYSFTSAVQTSRFTESDICINSVYTYINGNDSNYCDYQGVFTHELGHALGLGDVGTWNGTAATCPTMYDCGTLDDSGFIYYYLRTLTSDDKSGKSWIGTTLGYN